MEVHLSPDSKMHTSQTPGRISTVSQKANSSSVSSVSEESKLRYQVYRSEYLRYEAYRWLAIC